LLVANTQLTGTINATQLAANSVNSTIIAANTISNTNIQTGAIERYISSAGLSFGMRNRIINGGFIMNQRGHTSGTALASGSYGHDRWKGGASGGTYTFTAGSTGVNITITITAGSIIQVIEGANLPVSGTYVLSWTGTAQGKIGSGSFGSSGITGTITAGTNTNIEFSTGTCGNVQLEIGSVATSFDYRPFTTELALCQRYFEKSYNADVAPAAVTSIGAISYRVPGSDCLYSFRNKVEKRTTATYTIYNPVTGTAGEARNMDSGVNYTVTGAYASACGITIIMSGSSGAHIQFQYTSSSEL
jgi:hypothetical protein